MVLQNGSLRTGFHIFLSPIRNESRFLKEALTSIKYGIVDQVVIVGLGEDNDTEYQQLAEGVHVWRMKLYTRHLPKNVVVQVLKLIEWTVRIVIYSGTFQNIFIHAHSLTALPVGTVLKFMRSLPLVYDAHELETESSENDSAFRKILSRWAEKIFIRFADVVIVVSTSICEWYQREYGIRSIVLIPNSPYLTHVEKGDIFRSTFKISTTAIIYLYQGGLTPGRGINTLLTVFSELDDDRYHIVFMGYGPLQKEIESAARLFPTIHFHEAVAPDPEILLSYTSSADCGVFIFDKSVISYNFSMPNKVFEYMMAGLPMIVTDGVELAPLIQKNRIGFTVTGEDKEQLKDVIIGISHELLNEISSRVELIRSKYCWENIEELLVMTYKGIV